MVEAGKGATHRLDDFFAVLGPARPQGMIEEPRLPEPTDQRQIQIVGDEDDRHLAIAALEQRDEVGGLPLVELAAEQHHFGAVFADTGEGGADRGGDGDVIAGRDDQLRQFLAGYEIPIGNEQSQHL